MRKAEEKNREKTEENRRNRNRVNSVRMYGPLKNGGKDISGKRLVQTRMMFPRSIVVPDVV